MWALDGTRDLQEKSNPDWKHRTIKELQDSCTAKHLSTSGTKKALTKRLIKHNSKVQPKPKDDARGTSHKALPTTTWTLAFQDWTSPKSGKVYQYQHAYADPANNEEWFHELQATSFIP